MDAGGKAFQADTTASAKALNWALPSNVQEKNKETSVSGIEGGGVVDEIGEIMDGQIV